MEVHFKEVILDTKIMLENMKDRDTETLKRYSRGLTRYINAIQNDLDKLNEEINNRIE